MAHGAHVAHAEHKGLSIRRYILIGALLTAITAVELGLSYAPIPMGPLVAFLLVLSAVKFAIVVAYFMHLRFEDGLLTRVFVGGFVLATLILIALLGLFWGDAPGAIAGDRAYTGGTASSSTPAH